MSYPHDESQWNPNDGRPGGGRRHHEFDGLDAEGGRGPRRGHGHGGRPGIDPAGPWGGRPDNGGLGGPGFAGGPGFPDGPGFPGAPGGRRRGQGRGGRARRGDVRTAILALLAEEPMNGYQIIQALETKTNGVWKPSPGAVYPALSQLTDEGLVAPVESADKKSLFELTDAGREASAAIQTKPWDSVNAENSPANAEGAAGFWQEFGKLASAARTVAMVGDEAQLRAASDLVAETRRKLFGILAQDAS